MNFFNSRPYESAIQNLSSFMKRPPNAWATIRGSQQYPNIRGSVRFYQLAEGALTVAEINGLPTGETSCGSPVFAFHIHDGGSCEPLSPPPRPMPTPPNSMPLPQRPAPLPLPTPALPNDNVPTPPDNVTVPNNQDPFPQSGTHYNPNNCAHPYHAGDLPPLFSADGYAFLAVISNRFTAREIIGKTVIIHSKPDDFKTQPSGDAGQKIACGVITTITR